MKYTVGLKVGIPLPIYIAEYFQLHRTLVGCKIMYVILIVSFNISSVYYDSAELP